MPVVVLISGILSNCLTQTLGNLLPLQQVCMEHRVIECLICTPASLITAKVRLDEDPRPSEEDAREWESGNLSLRAARPTSVGHHLPGDNRQERPRVPPRQHQ